MSASANDISKRRGDAEIVFFFLLLFLERQVTAAGGQGGWLATRLTPAAQVQF